MQIYVKEQLNSDLLVAPHFMRLGYMNLKYYLYCVYIFFTTEVGSYAIAENIETIMIKEFMYLSASKKSFSRNILYLQIWN